MAKLTFSNSAIKAVKGASISTKFTFKDTSKSKAQQSLESQVQNLEMKLDKEGVDKEKKPSLITHIFNALDSLSNAIKVPIQRSQTGESKGLLTDVFEGLTYQEEGSYSQILKNAGIENNAIAFVGGLALEIIADPLNYIPVAGIAASTKEATELMENINKARKQLKGTTFTQSGDVLKGIDNIRNIDKSVLRLSNAPIKPYKIAGIDTGMLSYRLDDIIFGAAFKGIGRGAKAAFNQLGKLAPDTAKVIGEQLSGLARYAKSIFVNSANINKASSEFGNLQKTIAEMSFVQKNLDDLGNLIVKNIQDVGDDLVKKGLFKTSKEAIEAINIDVLKVIQNKNDIARTVPEILNNLLTNNKYVIAQNLDELLASQNTLSDFVKQLQEIGVTVQKSENGLGTVLRLDPTIKEAAREEYYKGIREAMSDLLLKTEKERFVLPKLQHARNELLKDNAEIEKIANGVQGFIETLQSSIKDRQDLIKFSELLGNDVWLHKILTQEAKLELLSKNALNGNIQGVVNYSKSTIGEADYKLFVSAYDTTALDTNIILGHNLFEFDIAKILQESNERFTKNIYADVVKYDVVKAGLADGVIQPLKFRLSATGREVVQAPAGFTEIDASELQNAINSIYDVNRVVNDYDFIKESLDNKVKAEKTIERLSRETELDTVKALQLDSAKKTLDNANDTLSKMDTTKLSGYNEIVFLQDELKSISKSSNKSGRIIIDNGYYNMIKRVSGAKEEIKGVLGLYNRVMSMFKTTSLFSVGFHIRNFFGNTMNMYLRGIPLKQGLEFTQKAGVELAQVGNVNNKIAKMLYDNPKLFDSIKGSKNATEGLLKVVELKFPNDYKVFKEYVEAVKDGIFDSNKYVAEISDSFKESGFKYEKTMNAVGKGRQLIQKPFDASFKLGLFSDNMTRYAIWKWAKANPSKLVELGADNARLLSKEIMFDFNDLTSTEVTKIRQLIPFYTWASKNVAFQFRNIMVNSGKYRNVDKLYREFRANAEREGQEELPEYAEWNIPLPIGDGSKVEYLSLTPTYIDGMQFIQGLVSPQQSGESFLAGSNPFLKAFLESQSGLDTFTKQPLDNSAFASRLWENLSGGIKRNIGELQFVNGIYKSKDKQTVEISNLYEEIERLRKLYNKTQEKSD